MEVHGKRTFWSLIEEEQKTIQSPTNHSFKTIQENPESEYPFSSPSPSLLAPPSPESPLTFSPLCIPPSPSLLYHCVASLQRHEGNILAIAGSRGVVFTGTDSSRVGVWRQPECIERGHIKTNSGGVRAILAYDNMLFTTHKDYKIRVWNVSVSQNFHSSKKIVTLPRRSLFSWFPSSMVTKSQQHKDYISCIAYYHAEGLLYTGSRDKTVKVWSLTNQKCVDSFVAHEDKVNAILVNQEDGCVFSCSRDGSVKIWRCVYWENSHTLTMTLRFQPSPVNAMALSSSANGSCILYSASADGFINFWEKENLSGRYNHGGFLQGHRFAVLCLVAVETLVFSGSEDTTIRVWRREEGSCFHECLAVLNGHCGPVTCLAACLEMEKIVTEFLVYSASLDQTLKVWRVKAFAEENKENCYQRKKIMEYEMSPVLSPSWVEKKLQGKQLQY